jgi:hypothetical protein
MRATRVDIKLTKAGQPWAVLEGRWRGLRLRCVVFPTMWAKVDKPEPGDAVVMDGELLFGEEQAIVWVKRLTKLSLA